MGDVPVNVAEFVRTHEFPKDAYIYALATCGSSWGRTFRTLQNLLQAQGLQAFLEPCASHRQQHHLRPVPTSATICTSWTRNRK